MVSTLSAKATDRTKILMPLAPGSKSRTHDFSSAMRRFRHGRSTAARLKSRIVHWMSSGPHGNGRLRRPLG